MSEQTTVYFAYGSNLLFARLHARTPSIENVGIGRLPDHRLSFTKPGGDGSGKCGIEPCTRGSHVLGVLYRMHVEEKPILDHIEGVGHGYQDHPVEVHTDQGPLQAFTYYPTVLNCELPPFDWYREFVLQGARENGFPESYITMIEEVKYMVDENHERRSMNLAISQGKVPGGMDRSPC